MPSVVAYPPGTYGRYDGYRPARRPGGFGPQLPHWNRGPKRQMTMRSSYYGSSPSGGGTWDRGVPGVTSDFQRKFVNVDNGGFVVPDVQMIGGGGMYRFRGRGRYTGRGRYQRKRIYKKRRIRRY